jgi:uncharacterized protein YlxW (UPF0749 family)
MTRIKHIVRQVLLDNIELNVRAWLVKVAKIQTTVTKERENRSIKKTRSLLRKREKKSHRFRSKSTQHRLIVSTNLSINRLRSRRSKRNTTLSKVRWFTNAQTAHEKIDERIDARSKKWYTFSDRCDERSARSDRDDAHKLIWK